MVFANTCGHCTSFKQSKLKDVLAAFKNNSKVKIVQITLNSIGEQLPKSVDGESIPESLNSYVGYYPIFILVPPTGWKSGTLQGISVYGAQITNGQVKPLPSNPNKDTLMDWVLSNIHGSTKLETGVVQSKLIPTEGSCNFKIVPRR